MQKWIANELHLRKGRACTITRESHVVDEKEPDIRLQSNATEANLPIEIKVAEDWSLSQLEDALTVQLTGRYLRERDLRHGILLLVHQDQRFKGWQDETGAYLTFAQVVARLKRFAYALGSIGQDAAYAEIATIDVSDITITAARSSKNKAKTPATTTTRKKKSASK